MKKQIKKLKENGSKSKKSLLELEWFARSNAVASKASTGQRESVVRVCMYIAYIYIIKTIL